MKNNSILKNWIYIGISFSILVIITVIILISESRSWDMALLKAIQAILINYPVTFAQAICSVGKEHCLLWPQITAVSVLFSHKKYFNGILLVIFTQISWHCLDLFKEIIGRERPCGEMCYGFSFPSGHATTTMCFYGILIYLILHYVKNKFWRYFLTIVLSVFIFLVAISRMKLNVHFPTDILAGLCCGFILVNLFIIISKKLEEHNIK